jgi:RNA polymerase sigma factor (sigma-70 family)
MGNRGPTREQGLAIHRALLDNDPTATSDLIRLCLEPLLAHLGERFPDVPCDLREQAAHDALIALCRRPTSFDPERDPDLLRYLRRSAEGDLLNALRSERSRRSREILVAVVEDRPCDGNEEEEDDPVVRLMACERQQEIAGLLDQLEESLAEGDRCVLRLLREGEARTEVFAEALGLVHLSRQAQQRAVKQAKDRVKKHLRREGARHARSL